MHIPSIAEEYMLPNSQVEADSYLLHISSKSKEQTMRN